MGFNFNIFTLGGGSGSGSGSGIAKYPNAAALPGSAADGDVAITLDTNNLYSYDSGVVAWVIIGGPGVAVTFGDSASVLTNFLGNVATSYLNIEGITNPPSSWGVSLVIGNSGLYAYQRGYPVYGQTSATWNTVGQTATVLGGSLLLDIRPASGSNSGLVNTDTQSFSGDKFFNNLIAGFSGFGFISGAGGPGTVYLGAPNSVPSSYNILWPSAQGSTFSYLMNNGIGGMTWSTISATFLSGITGPVIANGPGVGTAVMQAGGITLANFTGINPNTFLGNPTGATSGVTTITLATAKSLLGISLNNFGDVTVGSFSYVSFAQGLTISAAQVLQAGWGDTSNPGMIGPTHQIFAGDKKTTGNLGTYSYLQFLGSSLLSIGTTNITTGYTLLMPSAQGTTFTTLQNDGRGNLSWVSGLAGYQTVTNAGATLPLQSRFVDVTTGVTNQTLNIGWAAAGNTGLTLDIVKIDSGLGTVTIQTPDLINGATNYVLNSQWQTASLVCNGLAFRVLS